MEVGNTDLVIAPGGRSGITARIPLDTGNTVSGDHAGYMAVGMEWATIIGDHACSDIVAGKLFTVIGNGKRQDAPVRQAMKALYGIDPISSDDLSGKILIQLGPYYFDMQEVLIAAQSRQSALASGVPVADLWADKEAVDALTRGDAE